MFIHSKSDQIQFRTPPVVNTEVGKATKRYVRYVLRLGIRDTVLHFIAFLLRFIIFSRIFVCP